MDRISQVKKINKTKGKRYEKKMNDDKSHLNTTTEGSQNANGDNTNDAQDLTVFVQSLLEQMQARFSQMSDAIIGRIDEMGSRIDELEKSISDLVDQTNDETNGDQQTPSNETTQQASS